MEALIPVLLEHGLPGVIIAALGFGYWRKDQKLQQVNEEMVKLAAQVTEAVLAIREWGKR